MKDGKKISIATEKLVEIVQLLRSKGYEVNGIDYTVPPEKDGEIGLYFTVKVSKYVTSESEDR